MSEGECEIEEERRQEEVRGRRQAWVVGGRQEERARDARHTHRPSLLPLLLPSTPLTPDSCFSLFSCLLSCCSKDLEIKCLFCSSHEYLSFWREKGESETRFKLGRSLWEGRWAAGRQQDVLDILLSPAGDSKTG